MNITAKRTLVGLAIILGLLLSAPGLFAQRDPLDQANCALTPDQILGQAYSRTAGAAGEIGEGGLTPGGEDIIASGLSASAEWIMQTLPYSSTGTERVAILIVDDFSSEGDAETPPSHGWLVHEVLESLHTLLPPAIVENIQLWQVNIAGENGYRSDLIVPQVQAALTELRGLGITRVVLNLSFVFIPCRDQALGFDIQQFVAARVDNPGRSLVEQLGGDVQYVRSILRDSRVLYIDPTALATADQEAPRDNPSLRGNQGGNQGGQVRPTPAGARPEHRPQDLRVLQLFGNTRLQNDPLRDVIRQTRGMTIVAIASSGNFKQRQPFYPARWPEVLSVSANEGENLRFWIQSNNGDVSAPGAWFPFADDEFRAGTSFAAPVVSMLVAMDMTQSQPQCRIRNGRLALGSGNYGNQPVEAAAAQLCR